MRAYADSSLLVSSITRETGTERARAALSTAGVVQWIISDWVVPEVSSALSLKLRRGMITEPERSVALDTFRQLIEDGFDTLEVGRAHFYMAATFANDRRVKLRASDALHLAVAAGHSLTMLTMDRDMAQAGPLLGVETRLI